FSPRLSVWRRRAQGANFSGGPGPPPHRRPASGPSPIPPVQARPSSSGFGEAFASTGAERTTAAITCVDRVRNGQTTRRDGQFEHGERCCGWPLGVLARCAAEGGRRSQVFTNDQQPPPGGFGFGSPSSRARRSTRETLASPTPNSSAISLYVS